MELQKKITLKKSFNSIPLKKREILYRHVRMVLKVLVKACKMLERYPASDPTFNDIIDNFLESVHKATEQVPVLFVTAKKVGFYYCDKKIKLMDSGEKMFRSIFVVNNVREFFVSRDVSAEEVRNFFRIIRLTADYTGKDYSLNSLLWDYKIKNIGTISFSDMGEFQKPSADEFAHSQPADKKIENLNCVKIQEMLPIIRDFDDIKSSVSENFIEFRDSHGETFILRKYLKRQRELITSDVPDSANKKMLNKFLQFTRELFKTGRFTYAVCYFKELLKLKDQLELENKDFYKEVKDFIDQINTDKFISNLFDVAVTLTKSQIESFGEFLTMVSGKNFDTVFSYLVEHEDKDVRMHCLRGIARNFNDYETAKKLLTHESWYYVRNALYILRFTKNDDFLPLIRNVMNHEKKQIRIEAAKVLSMYDADENLPYWEKAVKSPDYEIRELSVRNLVKVKNMDAKRILDTIFRHSNLKGKDEDEILKMAEIIIDSRRKEMFDLIGNLMFFEKKRVRMEAMKILSRISDPEPILFHLKKKVRDNDFMDLDIDEIKAFTELLTPSTHIKVLPLLEKIFDLSGSIFNRKKYRDKKKAVIDSLAECKKTKTLKHWLLKGMKTGNRETKNLLENIEVE